MPEDFDFGNAMEGLVASGEVKLDTAEAPTPSPAPSPEAAGAPEPSPAPAPEAAPAPAPEAPSDYPKSWKPDFKDRWATLDPDVRAEVLRREDDFHKGIAPYRQLAERVKESLTPVADLIQQGSDPFQLVQAFGTYHQALSNPKTAVEAFKSLMSDYGVTVEQLTAEAPYVHPQVKALQDELGEVKSRLSAADQQALQQRQQALRNHLNEFAADPKNSFFNDVAGEMAKLIRADSRLTLQEAYDQACWLNPSVRERVLAKQAEEKAAAARAAAQASAGSVRSNARTAPVTGAVGSMDDTMRETLAALKNRSG